MVFSFSLFHNIEYLSHNIQSFKNVRKRIYCITAGIYMGVSCEVGLLLFPPLNWLPSCPSFNNSSFLHC